MYIPPSCFPSVKFVLNIPTLRLLPHVATSTAVSAWMDGWQAAVQLEAAQSANASWRKKNFRNWHLESAAFARTHPSFQYWHLALCPAGHVTTRHSVTRVLRPVRSFPSMELRMNQRERQIRSSPQGQFWCQMPPPMSALVHFLTCRPIPFKLMKTIPAAPLLVLSVLG